MFLIPNSALSHLFGLDYCFDCMVYYAPFGHMFVFLVQMQYHIKHKHIELLLSFFGIMQPNDDVMIQQ